MLSRFRTPAYQGGLKMKPPPKFVTAPVRTVTTPADRHVSGLMTRSGPGEAALHGSVVNASARAASNRSSLRGVRSPSVSLA